MDKARILELLHLLNDDLAGQDVVGELYLVGGAVMCLALDARVATKDLDAYFRPTAQISAAVARIAASRNLSVDWLNEAVKGFFGGRGGRDLFLDLKHLKVYIAKPEYLLAIKSAAMRLGEGFQDAGDVRYLLRYLNIDSYEKAIAVVTQYFDLQCLPAKTLYALEEMTES